MMRWIKEHRYPILINILALVPLVWLVWDFAFDHLSADPIREIQLRTGRYALILLVISLACTTVYRMFRHKSIRPLRRLSGIYAFSYASLHFLNFVGVDYGFDLSAIQQDVLEKRFALAGLAAFLLLIPLVITSTNGWRKKLGKNWKRLHRLIYLIDLLAIIHFIWLSKIDIRIPLIYGTLVVILLIIRLPAIRSIMSKTTKKQTIRDA
ncbi:sulfite oxidase heme-binding subunit YedZ [Chloroflexota bacterium]